MRKLFAKIHLWISLPLGILFSVICLTGAILVFDDAPEKKGERTVGKEIVGYSTLAMAIVLMSGIVIWWPRNRKVLKNRLSVTCSKGSRRFWYDSHVSIGFYATLLLLIMCLTGLVWSFTGWREAFWNLFDFIPPEGRKRFLYTLHTGSWGGLPSKIIYFLAALTGAVLPLTGYYLWWNKKK